MKQIIDDVIIMIPARMDSERFPGKPLALYQGLPMVVHVYLAAIAVQPPTHVFIVTPDEEIVKAVRKYSSEARIILDERDYATGTDRVAAAAMAIRRDNVEVRVVINIQCDIPTVPVRYIQKVLDSFARRDLFNEAEPPFVSLMAPVPLKEHNYSNAYVVTDKRSNAMYFSRHPIPYNSPIIFEHIGIYGYAITLLSAFTNTFQSKTEKHEHLEQNRWLESNGSIHMIQVDRPVPSIDYPTDMEKLNLTINK